jgi:putative glutamine amidotransferase
VLVPVTPDRALIAALLDRADGALVPGGPDVNPLLFGEEPRPQLGEICPAVDDFQLKFIAAAAERGLPILGLCRGLLLLNVAFGGTLHQDIGACAAPPLRVKHQQAPTARHVRTHTVTAADGTGLRALLARAEFTVNSAHHQAVCAVAPGFRVTAVAKDGVVEGIEKADDPRVFAVQWDPEEIVAVGDTEFCPLFEFLVASAREYRAQHGAVN